MNARKVFILFLVTLGASILGLYRLLHPGVPEELDRALQNAETVTLLSLDPHPDPPQPEGSSFHDYSVLGKTELRGSEKTRLLEELRRIPTFSILQAACFSPRHGVSVRHQGHTYDWVLCLECHKSYAYRDGVNLWSLQLRKDDGAVLNALLERRGIPRARPPGQ